MTTGLRGTLSFGVAALATGTAVGQPATHHSPKQATAAVIKTAPEPAVTEAAAPPATTAPSNAAGQIVVTGSRVIKNGNNSPTPVTVVSTEQMLNVQPTTVIDAVNAMPALQGSQSTSSNPGGGQRNGAAAYINLRNLGDLRTLVLMDGHRVIPSVNGMNADVDAWAIPQMLIERVDVVTGGVSAVYGSDAISGVVNFITDKKFDGIKVNASDGISKYSDDNIYDIGVAAGTHLFNGRGHIEVSGEYHNDPGILSQLDRPYFANSPGGAGLGTSASPYINVTGEAFNNSSFGGLVTAAPGAPSLVGLNFYQNSVLSRFNSGTLAAPGSTISYGGDGAWFNTASIKSALKFKQLFGRFDFDVSDSMHFYVQGAWTDNHTQNGFRAPLEQAVISYQNPFVLAVPQLAAQAALTPNGSFTLRRFIDIPATADQWTKTYMLLGGLEGKIANYDWDIHLGQSQSRLKAQNEVQVDQGRFFAAADAVDAGLLTTGVRNGQVVCRAGLAYPGHAANSNYANCVPINLFGPGSVSPAALNYILSPTWNVNTTRLTELSGSISGAPFSTWAGQVNTALSAEYRRVGWMVTSNGDPNDRADCVGILSGTGCTANTVRWLQTVSPALAHEVAQKVTEGAAEIDVPLAADARFAQKLNLNGAIRYTHYSTSGDVTTWKIGLLWQPFSDLRIRATRSRDIRAPNVFELFSPTGVAPSNFQDALTGANLSAFPVQTVSNANLTSEKAKSWTAGFVWTPAFLPRLSLSVDAYWITVSNAIVLIQGNTGPIQQICAATQGADPACQAVIVRPLPWTNTTTANNPTAVFQKWLNIASLKTNGVDIEASYTARLAGRSIDLRALASYQPNLTFDQGPFGVLNLGNVATAGTLFPASPKFKYTLIADIPLTDRFKVSLMERGRGSMKAFTVTEGLPQKVFANGDRDAAISYTNLTLAYDVGSGSANTNFYFNVQNLFNKHSRIQYAGPNANPGLGLFGFFPPSGDDVVGRYYTIGVRTRFK
jgi:iron complex outermembrane receptor protein